MRDLNIYIPDVRDGLTRLERAILVAIHDAKKEYGERHIPTAIIYGRVAEMLPVSPQEFELGFHSAMAKRWV